VSDEDERRVAAIEHQEFEADQLPILRAPIHPQHDPTFG
jgi:hypothetical protein